MWLEWVFTSPPNWFLWIGGICGIIATVLAAMTSPTIFHIIFGKPKLHMDFNIWDQDDTRVLECDIYNPPIQNRLLRALGVSRKPAADVVAAYSINEAGSNTVVVPRMAALFSASRGTPPDQTAIIPESIFPARFGVVGWNKDINQVVTFLKPQGFDAEIILPLGQYRVLIELYSSGKRISAVKEFVVGGTSNSLRWL